MANAVIVVDMQRGFLEEGNPLYCGDEAREVIPYVQKLLENEAKKGSAFFFTVDSHDEDDLEFEMFPKHCVKGTEETEIVPELAKYVPQGTMIPKTRYSGFFNTNLEARLAKLQPEKIIVVGVCTDICVMHTVADARNRDYEVEVHEKGVASFDPEAHKFALSHMDKILGARIV